jgi:tripartite-type tricarboxylate transporter receptor subunit TctC
MMLFRRYLRCWTIGAAALLTLPRTGSALDYPARPVTLVVPFAAGSSPDAVARTLSPRLTELLGQQIVIENVGGAGGMIGAARVARAQADGYQILLGGAGPNAVSQALFKNPLFNSTDLAPVALLAEAPLVLVARKEIPADTLEQFLGYVKANQRSVQYGSAGAINHLTCALLTAGYEDRTTHVSYRGGGQAMQDLIAGRIDYLCPLATVAVPHIRSGQIKAVAVLTKHRSPILPDLASAHEQGLTNFDASSWFALFLPRGAPPEITKGLREAAIATISTAAVKDRLNQMGVFVVPPERRSPEYLQNFVESEILKWARPIQANGLSTN